MDVGIWGVKLEGEILKISQRCLNCGACLNCGRCNRDWHVIESKMDLGDRPYWLRNLLTSAVESRLMNFVYDDSIPWNDKHWRI